jgi:hypothetical protein
VKLSKLPDIAMLVGAWAVAGCVDSKAVEEVGLVRDVRFRFGAGREWMEAVGGRPGSPIHLELGWSAQDLPGAKWVGRSGWYRWNLELPKEPVNGGLMVSAGFVANNSERYLNGQWLGGVGSFDRLDSARPRTVHAVEVDPSLLRWGGANEVAVRVRNVAGDGGILGGPVGLFRASEFMPEIRRLEGHRDWMKLSVASICLGLALVFAATWFAGERGQPWLAAALLMACGGVTELMSTSLAGVSGIGGESDSGRTVWLIMVGLQPLLTLHAIRRLCRQRVTVWDWLAWLVGAMALSSLWSPIDHVQAGSAVFLVLVLVAGLACFRHMLRGRRERVALATPLLVASLVFAATVNAQLSLLFVPWLPAAALWWEPLDWGHSHPIGGEEWGGGREMVRV